MLSEVVQSILPNKTFDFGDVVVRANTLSSNDFKPASVQANLLGSSIGITLAYHLEKQHRRRREVRRTLP